LIIIHVPESKQIELFCSFVAPFVEVISFIAFKQSLFFHFLKYSQNFKIRDLATVFFTQFEQVAIIAFRAALIAFVASIAPIQCSAYLHSVHDSVFSNNVDYAILDVGHVVVNTLI